MKNLKLFYFIFSLCFIFFHQHFAYSNEVNSNTTGGTGTLSQEISYSGEQLKDKKSDLGTWDWNFAYTYTAVKVGSTIRPTPSTKTTTSSTSASSTDHTNTLEGGFGYTGAWSRGLSLTYSNTKEENLTTFGPQIYAGYHIAFDSKKSKTENETADDEEVFIPGLDLKITGGVNRYTETYNVSSRSTRPNGSKAKTITKDSSEDINQTNLVLDLTLKPLSWFDIKFEFTKYHYNKDVANFLSLLDRPGAIASGAAGFSTTLSGFSSQEYLVGFDFFLPLDFDLNLSYSQATSQLDGSKTHNYKAGLDKLWNEHWKTGIGIIDSISSTDALTTGELSLAYSFN